MSEVGYKCGTRAVRILRIPRTLQWRELRREKRADHCALGSGGSEFFGRQHENFPRRAVEVIRRSPGAPGQLKLRQLVHRSRKISTYLCVTDKATFKNDAVSVLLGATNADLHVRQGCSSGQNEVMIKLHGDVWVHPELPVKFKWLHHSGFLLIEAQKLLEDSSFFHTSGMLLSAPSIYVHIIPRWKKVKLLTCVSSDGSRTGHQRRCFCTVRMPKTQLHIRGDFHVFLFSSGGAVSFVRAYSKTSHPETPLYKNKTAYYDILQVSPSATHAQIKTAYYKQSFVYHPDRNAGSEEATLRFSEISEAYMVLGNRGLKKKYDRGILSQTDLQGAGRPSVHEEPAPTTTAQQTSSQYSPSKDMGGKSIFDFDAFFQAHYAEQLQREKDLRLQKEQFKEKQREFKDRELGRMTEISVGLLLMVGLTILLSVKSSK